MTKYAEGSLIIELGDTRVLCTATIENTTPKWLQGTDKGWITAEYSMLPRSTHERIRRDKAFQGGRSLEISRLIGRCLRAGIDLYGFGERQIILDCDVLQADGGTRTAAITGGFAALVLALNTLQRDGHIQKLPVKNLIAAISVGMHELGPILDLNYVEDSDIDTDMNVAMTDDNTVIEIQGTAEQKAFTRPELNAMLDLAEAGCKQLFAAQLDLFEQCGIEFTTN